MLSYVDLDIDILVEPNFHHKVLDLEEFEQNTERYAYPIEIQNNARRAVAELIGLIETRSFPFDEQQKQ